MENESYGPHLTMDATTNSPVKLKDFELIFEVLDKLPAFIGMNKITRPYVVVFKDCKYEEWGISGTVMIAESHISIHTYPEKNYVFIDVFSCKPFDENKAIQYLKEKLDLNEIKSTVVKRGLNFPR